MESETKTVKASVVLSCLKTLWPGISSIQKYEGGPDSNVVMVVRDELGAVVTENGLSLDVYIDWDGQREVFLSGESETGESYRVPDSRDVGRMVSVIDHLGLWSEEENRLIGVYEKDGQPTFVVNVAGTDKLVHKAKISRSVNDPPASSVEKAAKKSWWRFF